VNLFNVEDETDISAGRVSVVGTGASLHNAGSKLIKNYCSGGDNHVTFHLQRHYIRSLHNQGCSIETCIALRN
jgi:hypothetical protein